MPVKKKQDEWLTISAAVKITGRARRTIQTWISDPSFPTMQKKKVNGKNYILKSVELNTYRIYILKKSF